MKYPLPVSAYTFNATAKTITFGGIVPAAIGNILHVTNVTRGVLYFQPQAGPQLTGAYSAGVLTLACSTAGHSSSDDLLIIYDDAATSLPLGAATAGNQQALIGLVDGLKGAANSIDSKLPALNSGNWPVAPNVSRGLGAVDSNTQRVTLAQDGPGVAALNNIDTKTPALKNGSVPTEPLGIPGVARQLTAGSASANTALTSTCRRISMRAVGADIRYLIGSSSQTASATSHLIAIGERLDVGVPATPNIAVIRNGSTNGTLEVTELI